jgi:hypothetical protein
MSGYSRFISTLAIKRMLARTVVSQGFPCHLVSRSSHG